MDDCLLTIFETITNRTPDPVSFILKGIPMDSRPLNDIRAVSQVCRQWRELSIASPRIWARSIDLDVEPHGLRRGQWMEEVVERAGSAPLRIFGRVSWPENKHTTFNTQAFFVRLLKEWERIEELSVIIHGYPIPDAIQSRFLCRAPILKVFDVHLVNPGKKYFLETLESGSSQSLFGGYAPALRACLAPCMAFKLDSPWLANILRLAVRATDTCFTMNKLYSLLQRTRMLQELKFEAEVLQCITSSDGSHTKRIDLPNLSSISLHIHPDDSFRVLDYLSPGKLSVCGIRIVEYHPGMIPSFKKNIPFFISNYFSSNLPTHVRLVIERTDLRFSDIPKHPHKNPLCNLNLEITKSYIGLGNVATLTRNAEIVISCALDAIAAASTFGGNPGLFNSVTELTLDICKPTPGLLPSMRSLLALFPHVQCIRTEECYAHFLGPVACPDQAAENDYPTQPLFPKLDTLYLADPKYDTFGRVVSGPTEFLIQRKKMGLPISKFDLTTCSHSSYARDLCDLEQIDGLEVVWKGEEGETCTYVCGSGNPGRLKGIF